MPLLTIVEDFLIAAARRAVIEPQEDGTMAAVVPECPGVIAFGNDAHECFQDLLRRLNDWVRVSLELGNPLPVIDGIDLNIDAGRLLASYHHLGDASHGERVYWDEDELDADFAEHGEGI